MADNEPDQEQALDDEAMAAAQGGAQEPGPEGESLNNSWGDSQPIKPVNN